MNKIFIIFLDITLASAHTFVKRDASAAVSKEAISDTQDMPDPDIIRKQFNQFVDVVSNWIDRAFPKKN